MTDAEVLRIVAAAVQGNEETALELRTIRKINPGSNIWKVLCSVEGSETVVTLYVFPDASPEELTSMMKERLALHSPRWQAT